MCDLFNIRPEKKSTDPIEWPEVDPRRQYFWYRRNFELPDRLWHGTPLTMMEWMYEHGYSIRHYYISNWDYSKPADKLPFKFDRNPLSSTVKIMLLKEAFLTEHPFRTREEYLERSLLIG